MYFIVVEFAVVFNLILLVILIHCYRAIIPQPFVNTFFLLLLLSPVKYHYEPSWGNKMNYKFLFIDILLRQHALDKQEY